jgi:hypothetical protein
MRTAVAALVMLVWLPARADAPIGFDVDAQASELVYHIVHKLHRVDSVSHKVSGKAVLLDDGRLQVAVRVPSDSFDSGNVNRDAHQKEAVEAARYPIVELKGIADDVKLPATFPSTVNKTITAQLSFHGVEQKMDVPVIISFESATRAHAEAHFAVSLDAFKVERPSLMFMKIDDQMKIDAKLVWTRR